MTRPPSVKDRLRAFLIENEGQVVTSRQLQAVAAPASEWARRLRELRDEEGWPIRSHHDSDRLRPDEYLMDGPPPTNPNVRFRRGISARTRSEVLERNGFTCQACGLTPGDIDPETGRKVRLHVGHIVDKSMGGEDELSNLRALCSTCNQGAKNITQEPPSRIWLLSQVRRGTVADQRAVYGWLDGKFGGTERPEPPTEPAP